MSRAWSLGKSDRCKSKLNFGHLTKFFCFTVKMTAETKKNIFMQNVNPQSYNTDTSAIKKKEPTWR